MNSYTLEYVRSRRYGKTTHMLKTAIEREAYGLATTILVPDEARARDIRAMLPYPTRIAVVVGRSLQSPSTMTVCSSNTRSQTMQQDIESGQALQSTKSYYNLPCAHRQWRHDGNCALVHGYSRSVHFTFAAQQLDKCGFVVDFGSLKWLSVWLEYMFDHTLLLLPDDPCLDQFMALQEQGACAIRVLEYGVGMEGSARLICEKADAELRERTKGRCWVVCVEMCENEKNSARYANPNAGFNGWL